MSTVVEGVVVGSNGGSHTVQLGANCLPGTECQAWNETNAGHNSGMTPVNRKAGTGERTRGATRGNVRSFYSPVGFRHHWFERQISWCLSGAEPMENAMRPFLLHHATVRFSSFIRMLLPLAAAGQRQERSDCSEHEEAEKRTSLHWSRRTALRPLMTKQQKNSAEHG